MSNTIEEARERGYLIHGGSQYSEEQMRDWVSECNEKNQPYVDVLFTDGQATVTMDMLTVDRVLNEDQLMQVRQLLEESVSGEVQWSEDYCSAEVDPVSAPALAEKLLALASAN